MSRRRSVKRKTSTLCPRLSAGHDPLARKDPGVSETSVYGFGGIRRKRSFLCGVLARLVSDIAPSFIQRIAGGKARIRDCDPFFVINGAVFEQEIPLDKMRIAAIDIDARIAGIGFSNRIKQEVIDLPTSGTDQELET